MTPPLFWVGDFVMKKDRLPRQAQDSKVVEKCWRTVQTFVVQQCDTEKHFAKVRETRTFAPFL